MSAANAPLSILLIEDCAADVQAIRSMLDEAGAAAELIVVGTVDEGLHRVAVGGIDVVLLDLHVPCAKETSLVTAFHQSAPHIPILVVSDVETDSVALDAVQAGAQDCLFKSKLAGHWLWRALRYAVERQALEEQLRRSQKMQAIGQLAGGVAHDFNNLLTVINGRAQLALEKMERKVSAQADVELIYQTGQRAAVLTQQLLAFSRRQVLRPEILSLNAVVRGIEPVLRGSLPETLSFELKLAENIQPMRADRGQLEQVLVNLVVNARDAMTFGGTLTIETSNAAMAGDAISIGALKPHRAHDSGIINIKTLSGKSYVRLSVRDTGCGMDSETLSRAFEPFFTTKEQGKGTGLGLATVYGIVRQSGGHIELSSEVNKGTSVTIYLPCAEGVSNAEHSSKVLPAVTKGGETILLVEDEDDVRELICDVLLTKGYTVFASEDGKHALEICRTQTGQIDLMVTDVIMPGMSGPELAAAVHLQRPHLRVLFMSGYTGDSVAEQKLMERGAPFIQKPFKTMEFIQKVRSVLDEDGA